MINGKLEQFLDTGWFNEATLFYKGYIYWCEAQFDEKKQTNFFFVDKWQAENEDNLYYHSLLEPNNTLKWERVFEIADSNLDLLKKKFLEAKIFEGNNFWEVENEIAWLDEGVPKTTKS